ncbi:Smr/MutS family protein [Desulfurivibrio alkaliphilus]|uniref:Smr protein/MutS2 n=1 Tax=Desulfurivibrio alkaliphilus (strain DSM 19089 / UNIQEM U267 / AHT2) TaxID=589865 RepID=D6Z5E5_DESAT|nr:Smr/MutS family protein [Desulfurivibrio alkaliphilus]ADH84802.1 Smr protein/MutS2 [Desulfurivibrio alkaliphilus AHT 2]
MSNRKNDLANPNIFSQSATSKKGFGSLVDQYLDDLENVAKSEKLPPKPTLEQKLRRYPPPQEELDLHGLTAPEAEKAVKRFITHCRELRLATLRIITGKGLHSQGEPVLPPVTEAALATLQAEQKIAAFRWEKKRQGRGGALIVYLP